MIYLIAGRSGTGKDFLAQKLAEKGLKVLKSYTTRPRRSASEDTHIFISEREALDYTDRVAETNINGYEYFATREQVEESDVYIIDPNGIDKLTANMPDTEFKIIYMVADNESSRREQAIARADDVRAELMVFESRNASEKKQFDQFEKRILKSRRSADIFPDNVYSAVVFTNDYTEKTIDRFVNKILTDKQRIRHMKNIIWECVNLGILEESDVYDSRRNEPRIIFHGRRTRTNEPVTIDSSLEHCAAQALRDPNFMYHLMREYIIKSPRFEQYEPVADFSKYFPDKAVWAENSKED